MSFTAASLEQAASLLREGGLVAVPTETVYGLAANALDPKAVARIFAAKERPFFDPLIVHVPDLDWLPRVVSDMPPLAQKLADRFWPGPMTLVLPRAAQIPDLVTSGLPSVGVRIPDHEMTRQLLRLAQVPVAAPSANPFGRLSPTTAEHVAAQLGDRVDAILDGGPCRVGVESTVLKVDESQVTLLRPGGIPQEEIESLVGVVQNCSARREDLPEAPGMLESHYAPRTLLSIQHVGIDAQEGRRRGLVAWHHSQILGEYDRVELLSESGDLVEAAANFFQALHRLDLAGLDQIVAIPFPNEGLGRALNDRLIKAAHR